MLFGTKSESERNASSTRKRVDLGQRPRNALNGEHVWLKAIFTCASLPLFMAFSQLRRISNPDLGRYPRLRCFWPSANKRRTLAQHQNWRVELACRCALPLVFILSSFCLAEEIKPAADAPQPMSPEQSAAQMRLPDGFRIELVASEPVIQEPSCIAFDAKGRIFVTELHGYNVEGEIDVAKLNKTGKLDTEVRRLRWEFMGGETAEEAKLRQFGKVKLLKDTDGDGRMDKSIVWADDLPSAYGVVAARGGIIVVAAPDIVFLADTDGDDKPDVREVLFTGFHKREMERGINNPVWGIDNWIYIGAGGHGGTITGPHLTKPVDLHHSDFRIKADGTAIEPVTGRVGTFGLAMNEVGDRFPCSGGQPAIYALPMPYNMLTRNPHVGMPSTNHNAANYGNGFRISEPHPWRVRRRQDPAWIKFYGNRETDSNYFTGGCGGEIYTANVFPEEYRGNFFYCEPSLNIIHRCVLTRDGAGYEARRADGEETREFLASKDQWFRPMNLRVGPDGALYIIDMYREIIEDYSAIPRFLQQQYGLDKGRDRGRIWRLLPKGVALKEAKRYSTLDDAIAGLADSNMKNRQRAQRAVIELVSRLSDDAKLEAAERIRLARSGRSDGITTVHILHTLSAIGQLKRADLLQAMASEDYRAKLHALRLGTEMKEEFIVRMLRDGVIDLAQEHPAVRLQIALSLGEIEEVAPELVSLASDFGDERWMSKVILSSCNDMASDVLEQLMREETEKGRAITLIAPLASTIGAQRETGSIRSLLETAADAEPGICAAALRGLAQGLDRGTDPATKLEEIEMDRYINTYLKGGWTSDEDKRTRIRLAAKLFEPESSQATTLFQELAETAIDQSESLGSREFSVSVLSDAPFSFLETLSQEMLDSRQPQALQIAMAKAMSKAKDPRVTERLLVGWMGYTPEVRKQVLSAVFSQRDRIPQLLDVLETRKSLRPADLSSSQQELLMDSDEPRAKAILESQGSNAALADRIKTYEQALAVKRDLQHGKTVFTKTCSSCHKIGTEGYEVGPPLGSTLNKPDEAILIDILDPSSKVDSEYTSYNVVTTPGTTFTGVLAAESPTSVSLKLEKGQTQEILRNEIEVMKSSEVSLMPSNLHEQISPKDMADLLGYVRDALAGSR